MTKNPASLAALLESIIGAFSVAARAKGLELALETPGASCPPALVDEHRILQVLANLLSNAIKFTPTAGQIKVRLDCEGDRATIAVSDTGPGIAPEQLDRIFQRSVQARPGTGLGLGLFIARAIVEGHAGRIWAESRGGRGSTFFVTLPLS